MSSESIFSLEMEFLDKEEILKKITLVINLMVITQGNFFPDKTKVGWWKVGYPITSQKQLIVLAG